MSKLKSGCFIILSCDGYGLHVFQILPERQAGAWRFHQVNFTLEEIVEIVD